MRVLFVDDDADTVKLLPTLATDALQIDAAMSAASARERLAAGHGYDAAVIDWVLGESSGVDLLHWLRSREDMTPVVMVTAADFEHFRELEDEAKLVAKSTAMRKPYDLDEVLAACRRLAGVPAVSKE